MPQGLQVFRPDGSVALDLAERLGRVLGFFDIPGNQTSGTFNYTGAITGTLWAVGSPLVTASSANLSSNYLFIDIVSSTQINWNGSSIPYRVVYGVY